jgi:hypothetical protein
MESPLVRFEVTTTEYGHDHTVLGLVVDVISAVTSPGAGPPTSSGSGKSVKRYPEVAAYNSAGVRRVLSVMDTDEEARDLASAVEDDYQSMEIQEWCRQYRVPLSFVDNISS